MLEEVCINFAAFYRNVWCNVIGKFNDDKTSFNGFYVTFAIPAETTPIFPSGAILNFPFPVLNINGDKLIEEKVSEYVIASWLSAKDHPFMLQGCCEISYGEIDITLSKQIVGGLEIKKMPALRPESGHF